MAKRGGYRVPASGRYKAGPHPVNGHCAKGDGYMLTVACRFDDEMFAEIRARAIKENTSFAQMVRILVEIGLEESHSGLGPSA